MRGGVRLAMWRRGLVLRRRARSELKCASCPQHLDSHFGQMIADRLGRRGRVAGRERGGDFAVLVLVALAKMSRRCDLV